MDDQEKKEGGHAGAPEGNQNNLKFKTPEERKEFLNAYCEHIKQGYSDDSFSYKGSGIETFRNYRRMFPIEFSSDMITEASAERMKLWEKIGINGTVGKLAGFNAKSWEFNMKNRFKWKDRIDQTTDDDKIDNRTVVYMPKKNENNE